MDYVQLRNVGALIKYFLASYHPSSCTSLANTKPALLFPILTGHTDVFKAYNYLCWVFLL